MKTKSLSIILALIMLISLFTVVEAAGVSIAADVSLNSCDLPVGSKVPISISNPDGATRIEICRVENNEFFVEETVTNLATSKVFVSVAENEKIIQARAYNESEQIGLSNVVKVPAGIRYVENVSWFDLTFENTTVNTNGTNVNFTDPSAASRNITCSPTTYNDSYLRGKQGSDVNGSFGNVNNSIKVDTGVTTYIADNTQGNSLHLTSTGSGQVKLNNWWVQLEGEAVVFEMDFYSNLNTAGKYFVWTPGHYGVTGTTVDSSTVYDTPLKYSNGVFSVGEKTVDEGTNAKWHKILFVIDLARDTESWFVNGKLVNSFDFQKLYSKDLTKFSKMDIAMTSDASAEAFIDNVKVYTTTPELKTELSQSIPACIPVGTKVGITASAPAVAANIKYFDITNGKEALVGEGTPGTVVLVEAGYKAKTISAKAYDSNGYLVGCKATSCIIPAGVDYVTPESYKHNFSFEDADNTSITVVAGETGTSNSKFTIANPNSNFTGYTGTGTAHTPLNVMEIASVEGVNISGASGKALHMQQNGQSDSNQLNGIYTSGLTGTVIYEMDFYSNVTADNVTVVEPYVKGKFADGRDFGASVNEGYVSGTSLTYKNGTFTFNNKTIDVGTTPAWHNVKFISDLNNKVFAVVVDGEFLGTIVITELSSLTQTNRMCLIMKKTAIGDIWIDNFKVYSTAQKVYVDDIDKISYIINGNMAEEIGEGGELSVTPKVTSDGTEKTLICIIAVYNGNKLENISYKELEFLAGENVKEYTESLGNVTADMNIKAMLWTKEMSPVTLKVFGE